MNNLHIRPVATSDIPAIKAVIDSTGLFPSEYIDGMYSDKQDSSLEFWLTYAENEPRAVAYCVPEPMADGVANLLLLAVHEMYQGTGIGQKLMTSVENRLSELGVRLLLVETSAADEFARTRSFYEQRGYENEARIRDYYDVGDDKIVFRKAL